MGAFSASHPFARKKAKGWGTGFFAVTAERSQLRRFSGKLLHAVLAEEREAQRSGLSQRRGRKGLRDRHQLHFGARPAGGAAGNGDLIFELG